MAVVNAAQFITLYDVASGTELASLTPADPQNLCAPSFSPDGAVLAVGAEDHTVQIWDVRKLRNELSALDLDWELPSYPARPAAVAKIPPLFVANGLVEAECLEVVSHDHCEYSVEDMRPLRPKQWSSRKQLACSAEPGGFVELELPVSTTGQFLLEVGLTKGPEYGLVQVRLDGAPIGEVIDTFDPEIRPMGLTRLETVDLRPGSHRIGFAAVGKNPQATDHKIGIDTLKLSPVDPGLR